jgi:hypothetical protein
MILKKLLLSTGFLLLTVVSVEAQWVRMNGPGTGKISITCFVAKGMNLFAGTEARFAGIADGVFLTTNNGTTWTPENDGLLNTGIRALATIDTSLFAGTGSGGIYLSNNDGTNWATLNTSFNISAIAISGTNLFIGATCSGIYLSTDDGRHWTPAGLDNKCIISLAAIGSNLFAGTYGDGAYLSTDNGTNWTTMNSGLAYQNVSTFATIGTDIFAGTDHGVYRSTDKGTNWTAVNSGLPSEHVNALLVHDKSIFAATNSSVFISTDNGSSWVGASTGLTELSIKTLTAFGPYLFAGAATTGVWRRLLSDFEVDDVKVSNHSPISFSVFPNPSDNFLTIQSSAEFGNVQCTLFDQLGRTILHRVVLDFMEDKKVTLDLSNIPSGIYYLLMEEGGVSQSETIVIAR